MSFRAQPLRRQLLIAILLLLVPAAIAAVWSAVAAYREHVDELGERTRTLAARTAHSVNRELLGLDRMARMSANPAFQSLDPTAVQALLRPQITQRAWLVDVVVIDRTGKLIARTADAQDENETGSWMNAAAPVFSSGARTVFRMMNGPSGREYIAIGYPVRDAAGTLIASLTCYLDPQQLQDAFELELLPEGSEVIVMDADYRVLARSLDPERFLGQVVDTASMLPGPQVRDGIDGITRMYSAAMIDGAPWIASVGIPVRVAVDLALSLWARNITILTLGLGAGLVVALVLSRRLTQSVWHLDVAAQRIAGGDFTPLEHQAMASREFDELQDAFDRMLTRFNETRHALDAQMTEERGMRQELQSLQRQVIRQERLAAVGQLVSGVAHEINNPLQAILGFAELLQMQTDVPDDVKNDLYLIQKESARACGIIRNLALFARQQTGEAAPTRLSDVIKSVAELRERRLQSEDIELRVEDRSSQTVMAVLAELQQVLLNFVVNAEQAIIMSGRKPGRITVRTRDEQDRVILEVEDTGPGIPPEDEPKLFQPFFTTKPVGQGTGLGLSVSYGIIDSLGGHIGYRSAPAGGALFFFDLPAASE